MITKTNASAYVRPLENWRAVWDKVRPSSAAELGKHILGDVTGYRSPTHQDDDAEQVGRAVIAYQQPLVDLLSEAESFIAGFEGDTTQKGVDDLLDRLRNAILRATVS